MYVVKIETSSARGRRNDAEHARKCHMIHISLDATF